MSDEEKQEPEKPERDEARDSKDDEAISKLLKRSLASDVDGTSELGVADDSAPASLKKPSLAPPSLLPSVQRKLRERSKGKFYRDNWSTSQSKINYALVAILMLFVIAACYLALGPTGFSAR